MEAAQPTISPSVQSPGNLPEDALRNMIGGFVLQIFAKDMVIAQLQKRVAELETKAATP